MNRVLLVVLLILGAGCSTATTQPRELSVAGNVIWRERMLLPPDATLTVTLQDVSRQDVAAKTLAAEEISEPGPPPVAFQLTVDPALIDDRGRYSLRATITAGGRLMFTSTTFVPAFDSENPEILVERVPEARLPSGTWRLQRLAGAQTLGGKRPDLTFEANRVAGFAGCNRYFGSYSASGKQLTFSGLGATRMACPDTMALENAFLAMLDKVRSYSRTDEQLLLLDESGHELASFVRDASTTASYQCDDILISASFNQGIASLSAEGRRHTLKQVRAASGAKYEAPGIMFWIHGDEAMLEIDGQTRQCTVVDS